MLVGELQREEDFGCGGKEGADVVVVVCGSLFGAQRSKEGKTRIRSPRVWEAVPIRAGLVWVGVRGGGLELWVEEVALGVDRGDSGGTSVCCCCVGLFRFHFHFIVRYSFHVHFILIVHLYFRFIDTLHFRF